VKEEHRLKRHAATVLVQVHLRSLLALPKIVRDLPVICAQSRLTQKKPTKINHGVSAQLVLASKILRLCQHAKGVSSSKQQVQSGGMAILMSSAI
jgi:uncharacterized membrane protein